MFLGCIYSLGYNFPTLASQRLSEPIATLSCIHNLIEYLRSLTFDRPSTFIKITRAQNDLKVNLLSQYLHTSNLKQAAPFLLSFGVVCTASPK